MKKKNLLTMVATLSLTAVVMVGSTLAYLTSVTDTAKNTFTVGNVSISLNEKTDGDRNWNDETDGKNMTPGQTVVKKPIVTVNGNSESSYVYIKVTGADALEQSGFTVNEFNAKKEWTKISLGEGKDGIYRYNEVTTKQTEPQSMPEIFTSVTYKNESTGNQSGKIDITAAAVQNDNITMEQADAEATAKLGE